MLVLFISDMTSDTFTWYMHLANANTSRGQTVIETWQKEFWQSAVLEIVYNSDESFSDKSSDSVSSDNVSSNIWMVLVREPPKPAIAKPLWPVT
jgi:hypothetical protein